VFQKYKYRTILKNSFKVKLHSTILVLRIPCIMFILPGFVLQAFNISIVHPLGRPRRRCVDNIRMDLQDVGVGMWTGLGWPRTGTGGGRL